MPLPLQFSAALRGQRCCSCRCRSSWPLVSFVDQKRCSSRPFAALRGQKEVAVAVAVLRGPPCPPWTKVLPLPFFVALSVLRGSKEVFFAALRGPSWTKGSCRCRCSSPRPSVSSVDKGVAVAVLRGPSRPFVDKRKLPLPLQFSAALRVLRGQRCCRCRSSWPLVSFVDQKRCSSRPSRPFVDKKKLQLPLQFSAGLRGQRCCSCRCRSSWPLVSFVDQKRCSSRSFAALRGQKEVAVAVAVLRGPPCPPWTKVLPLPFFVALSVLRGSKEVFFAALRGPSWTKGSCRCRCSSPRPSVSSVDKGVAVAVLRGP